MLVATSERKLCSQQFIIPLRITIPNHPTLLTAFDSAAKDYMYTRI